MKGSALTRRFTFVAIVSSFLFSAWANEVKFVPGEMIVKLKKGQKSFLSGLKAQGVELKQTIKLSYGELYVVTFDQTQKSMESALNSLKSNAAVEYVEPNFIYEVNPIKEQTLGSLLAPSMPTLNYTPRDPQFNRLWGLHNTGDNIPTDGTGVAGADIDAIRAWEVTKGSRNVRIAVIDTGIDYNHPDLRDQMWVNQAELNGEAGKDDDGNGFIDDVYGYDFANDDGDPRDGHSHGTHCAGTIGATHDNSLGVAGVMSEVEFVAIKFLSDAGSGSTSDAVRSIDYATRLGVDLMSNSWGGGGYSTALKEAIERASDAGIIFVAAAGNSQANNDNTPHYPSSYDAPNVIAVAASTGSDDMAYFSCFGRESVDIAAPGHRILSTVKNGGYEVYSGTSMATPHVSGALGLLIAKEGRLPHDVMRERLLKTSEPVAALRGKTVSSGRLNAYNLVTNTRPDRNEPKPGEWQRVSLSEAWETSHPYQNNYDETRTFSFEGAKFVRLIIKQFNIEERYDHLKIFNNSRDELQKLWGQGSELATEWVAGDTLIATFSTDSSETKWGFVIEEAEVQY